MSATVTKTIGTSPRGGSMELWEADLDEIDTRNAVEKELDRIEEEVGKPRVPLTRKGRVRTIKGGQKPARNKECPCGSGLKYKKCCLDKANNG